MHRQTGPVSRRFWGKGGGGMAKNRPERGGTTKLKT